MKTIEEITRYYGPQLAKAAFELGAIRLSPKEPFTWASGYRMPIYNDNRQFLAKAGYSTTTTGSSWPRPATVP